MNTADNRGPYIRSIAIYGTKGGVVISKTQRVHWVFCAFVRCIFSLLNSCFMMFFLTVTLLIMHYSVYSTLSPTWNLSLDEYYLYFEENSICIKMWVFLIIYISDKTCQHPHYKVQWPDGQLGPTIHGKVSLSVSNDVTMGDKSAIVCLSLSTLTKTLKRLNFALYLINIEAIIWLLKLEG